MSCFSADADRDRLFSILLLNANSMLYATVLVEEIQDEWRFLSQTHPFYK